MAVIALGAALALFETTPAAAEPTAADRATARAMLDDGYALLSKGDAEAALKRFIGADALVGAPSTKLAVARAQFALGQLVEAHDTLTATLRLPAPADEPVAFKRARADAAELLAQTTARIPELTISIVGAEGQPVIVRVDDAIVPVEALVAPRRLNPGRHTIEASVDGAKVSAVAELAEAEKATVTLDLTTAIASTPAASTSPDAPAASTPPDAPAAPRREAAPSARSDDRLPWVFAGLGVAVVGAAVGTTAGFVALGRKADAEANGCVDNRCPPSAHADVDAAKDMATVSTIAFVAAGIGLAAAAVTWLLPGPSASAARSAPVRIGVGVVEGRF